MKPACAVSFKTRYRCYYVTGRTIDVDKRVHIGTLKIKENAERIRELVLAGNKLDKVREELARLKLIERRDPSLRRSKYIYKGKTGYQVMFISKGKARSRTAKTLEEARQIRDFFVKNGFFPPKRKEYRAYIWFNKHFKGGRYCVQHHKVILSYCTSLDEATRILNQVNSMKAEEIEALKENVKRRRKRGGKRRLPEGVFEDKMSPGLLWVSR